MFTAIVGGRAYSFNPDDASTVVGKGGEAVVFHFSPDQAFIRQHGPGPFVVKLCEEKTDEQVRAADVRQTKLPAFPVVPDDVVSPIVLAYNPSGRIIGYVMPLLQGVVPLNRLLDPDFRRDNGYDMARIVRVLLRLYDLILALHARGITIGDFNDKNVMLSVSDDRVFLVDADSMQWGSWLSPTFTLTFVDPTICNAQMKRIKPHTQSTDWYAFFVIAFQLLMIIHPYYGGGHHPPAGGKKLRRKQRIVARISVFHPEVTLSDDTMPLRRLPSGLTRCFERVFAHDERMTFPRELLSSFAWMVCPSCNSEHGRSKCPECGAKGVSGNAKPSTTRSVTNGAVTATRIFRPDNGSVLTASCEGGRLRYVFYQEGYYREDGRQVFGGSYDRDLQPYLAGDRTILGLGDQLAVFGPNGQRVHRSTQAVQGNTVVAGNSRHVYWASSNRLVRDDPSGAVVKIGELVANHTQVWSGTDFGLTLMRVGPIVKVRTFTDSSVTQGQWLPLTGERLIDASCVFSERLAWLSIQLEERRSGKTVNRCYAITRDGQLWATAAAYHGDRSWLGQSGIKGHATHDDQLLVTTNGGGILQIGARRGTGVHHDLQTTLVMNDAAPFVNTATQLLTTPDGGMVAVSARQVLQLTTTL